MNDEIDDFLRKAAERRKQRKNKSKPAPPPPSPTTRQPLQPLQQQPVAPQPISQPLSQHSELLDRHAVDQSVHQHIDTTGFTSRAHDQGFDDLEIIDERVDDRLHEKFDHSLGSLQSTSEEPQRPRRTSSGSVIAGLFSNPQNIRQAFIMSEIMKPLALRDDEPKRS